MNYPGMAPLNAFREAFQLRCYANFEYECPGKDPSVPLFGVTVCRTSGDDLLVWLRNTLGETVSGGCDVEITLNDIGTRALPSTPHAFHNTHWRLPHDWGIST